MVDSRFAPSGLNPHSWADIDLAALRHNTLRARRAAPGASLCAVIKANAYGHGMAQVAGALTDVLSSGDQFAVVTADEALALQPLAGAVPIVAMRGALDVDEMAALLEHGIEFVIHSAWQLALLEQTLRSGVQPAAGRMGVWLKVNTGMNRLGLSPDHVPQVWHAVAALANDYNLDCRRVLMSHLATSDDLASPLTALQHQRMETLRQALHVSRDDAVSLAASAGILAWPETHYTVVRPGIMLYGASPLLGRVGQQDELRPVMNLKSRLIAINNVEAGEGVGYGATYHSKGRMRIGVIGIGYGDGYPRHAPTGTPVLIQTGAGAQQARLVGRVSMDMLTVDLSGIDACVGDDVLLWGQAWGAQLPAEQIADLCQTIAYELFCQITSRVQFHYR